MGDESEITIDCSFTKEISVLFRCRCNNKVYDNLIKLKNHEKTKSHIAWQCEKELRELRISLKRCQEQNERLEQANIKVKKEYHRQKRINIELIELQEQHELQRQQ